MLEMILTHVLQHELKKIPEHIMPLKVTFYV